MRTTLDIQDTLLMRAKAAAAKERKSLTRVIEEGLRLRLRGARGLPVQPFQPLPVFRGGGGFRPGINPLSNRSIYDAADDDGA